MVDEEISELLNMVFCFRYFFSCISITAILARQKSPLKVKPMSLICWATHKENTNNHHFLQMKFFVLAMNVPGFGSTLNIL